MTRFQPQWLQAGSYAASVDRRLIGALWPTPASTGCQVSASSGMVVSVAAGQVAVPTANNTGTVLCTSDAAETVTVAAAATLDRIDLVVCQPRSSDIASGSGDDFIFTTVTGTAAASPAVPATPAGTVALAQIRVIANSASISAGNITDVRPGSLAVGGAQIWNRVFSSRGPATAQTNGTGTFTVVSSGAQTLTPGRYMIFGRIQYSPVSPFPAFINSILSDTGGLIGNNTQICSWGSALIAAGQAAFSGWTEINVTTTTTTTINLTIGIGSTSGTVNVPANQSELAIIRTA